ncbi:hypothetical protein [Halomonas eurihalina]|uniref:hypothetical protein n=1 Tax=Halomonas eurihalina TaxID=42566 RepID=UPI001659A099|nr:hypothetical protein [Halomonas eurihalina]MDR5857969.1 hypothetical protein [Halomonas eurihalina]
MTDKRIKNGYEEPVRQLTPSEFDALMEEMRVASVWMRAELKRRRHSASES